MAGAMEHVLSGIRVLDLSRALAGPSCTRMFAEMGAEVIKLEAAPNGDLVRGISKLRGNDRSLYYIQQNLGKKSVCVNLRDPRAIAIAPATGSIWTSACSTFTTTVTRSASISSAAVRVSSSRAARDRISTISRQPGYSKRPADGS